MKRSTNLYLQDILDSIDRILKNTQNLTKEEFLENIDTLDAVLRRFEIIGEATKQMSPDFKKNHPEIPWKQAAGMRNVMIHGYYMINLDRVWGTINNNLPKLRKQIQSLINSI